MDAMAERIVENADDAIVVADRDGTVVFWNPAAERIFGFGRDKAIGSHLDLIIPEKHRQAHADGYERVMETGVTKYAGSMLSVPALCADGSRIIVEFTVTMLRDSAGAVEGIAAIMRDVTERKGKSRRSQNG